MQSAIDAQNQILLFKYLVLGNADVGKSMLTLRFAENQFEESYIATIGVEFKIETIEVQGRKVKLQIWDTAGEKKFRTITDNFYKNAKAIFLVFGVNKNYDPNLQSSEIIQDTKAEIDEQLNLIRKQLNNNPSLVVFLVINRIDLAFAKAKDNAAKQKAEKKLQQAQSDWLAYVQEQLGAALVHNKVFLTSAKTNDGVAELFHETTQIILKRTLEQKPQTDDSAVPKTEILTSPDDRSSTEDNAVAEKTDLFELIISGIGAVVGSVVGGGLGCLVGLVIGNPLSLIYQHIFSSKKDWLFTPTYIILSPIVTVLVTLAWMASGFTWGRIIAWDGDLKRAKEKMHDDPLVKQIQIKHILASLIVLGVATAVVLSLVFPPGGFALWLPSMAAAVGLGGISTAVLAAIAGVTAVLLGSIVYGLLNWGLEKDRLQAVYINDSDNSDIAVYAGESSEQGFEQKQHAAAKVLGSPAAYQAVLTKPLASDASAVAPPPASGTPAFIKGSGRE